MRPGAAPQPLWVRDPRQRQLFRIGEIRRDFAIKQGHFALQSWVAMRRQGLEQILDHRPHAPDNLQIVRSAGTDLAEGEIYKVLPIRGPENQTQSPGRVRYFVG